MYIEPSNTSFKRNLLQQHFLGYYDKSLLYQEGRNMYIQSSKSKITCDIKRQTDKLDFSAICFTIDNTNMKLVAAVGIFNLKYFLF